MFNRKKEILKLQMIIYHGCKADRYQTNKEL